MAGKKIAANKMFRVKLKKNHEECACGGVHDIFGKYSEEMLGIKRNAIYHMRKSALKVGACLESSTAYIEVIDWHHANKRFLGGIAPKEELVTITSDELAEVLSVKVAPIWDEEDNVWFVLNLFKLRTDTSGSVIRGLYNGCLVLGYPYEFDHCFTLRDVESMQERGLFVTDTGMISLKITYNEGKNIAENVARLAEINKKVQKRHEKRRKDTKKDL